jgi:hypothetical protein
MGLEPPRDAVLALAWEAFVKRSTPIGAVVVEPWARAEPDIADLAAGPLGALVVASGRDEAGFDEVGFDELRRRIDSDTPGLVTRP